MILKCFRFLPVFSPPTGAHLGDLCAFLFRVLRRKLLIPCKCAPVLLLSSHPLLLTSSILWPEVAIKRTRLKARVSGLPFLWFSYCEVIDFKKSFERENKERMERHLKREREREANAILECLELIDAQMGYYSWDKIDWGDKSMT